MSLFVSVGPLAPADVARPGVVGDHVARLHAQILDRQQFRADLRDVRPRHPTECRRPLGPAGNGVDEIEFRDSVVVVRPRLNRHFLEGRDLLVAVRTQDPDVGRTIVHQPDEVFRLAAAA